MRTIILLFFFINTFSQSIGVSSSVKPLSSVWSFTKQSNYLLGEDNGSGGLEFYPPKVIREGATDWKVVGKVNNQIWRSTSADGITWGSGTLTVSKGAGGQWDDLMIAPTALKKIGSDYKILYSAYGDSPIYNYKIGYVTSTDFSTGWTKAPSYVYGVTDYNTANGTSWAGIQCSDAVLVGTTWYYFGLVFTNSFNTGSICYGVGSPGGDFEDVVLDTKIADFTTLNPYFTWCQGLNVFKNPISGVWYMTLNAGVLQNNVVNNNHSIYVLKSNRTDLPIFKATDFVPYPIMSPDVTKTYENSYNYNTGWLKDNEGNLTLVDGAYYFYYGGHQNTASPIYTGVTCLAKIKVIP